MNLSDLKGIGPSTLKKLEKLGIVDIRTLLYHFPTRYTDRRKNLKVFDLKFLEDENYHCIATIDNIKQIRLRGGRVMTNATLIDDTGYIAVTWFNNPYISSQYKNKDKVVFSGQINKAKVTNPKIKKVVEDSQIADFAKMEATYPETRGLRSYQLSNFIKDALNIIIVENHQIILENLSKEILKKEKLLSRIEALKLIHFPKNNEDIAKARDRFGFEEIYIILKELQKRKKAVKGFSAPEIKINKTTHEIFTDKLPFKLTSSQKESINEILSDLKESQPMHRLLNGDVGSGKTVVAAAAAWQVINNGKQVIFLAPTSVLANQHYLTLQKLFDSTGIVVHLLTSSTNTLKNGKWKIENGKKDSSHSPLSPNHSPTNNLIFVGTHALFYKMQEFNNVGLVVIDEQHKFGVEQRQLLTQLQISDISDQTSVKVTLNDSKLKSEVSNLKTVPHVLSMSATPIPRTLALTFFGDMDVSFLEKPETRKKIITKMIYDDDLTKRMYAWIKKEIDEKKAQVYVVCPLIEESAILDSKAVVKEYETLQQIFPECKVGLLHGKIKAKEKDQILLDFKNGEIDILVSTSVIEVGIDNPNATIMVIEGAERFGLAQLHQIRGRVGRSDKQSYCFLRNTTGQEDKRLELFASTNDGFKVAEFDLKHRGPGEVYGTQQSGIPNLKIANILDLELIKRVKKYVA